MPFKNLKDLYQFAPDKMKKNSLFETSRVLCDVYCFEPGQEQKVHAHDDQDKIYVVLEGSGTFEVGGVSKLLSREMAVLAEGGVDHGVKNTGSGRLVLLVAVAPGGKKGGKEGPGGGHHAQHDHGDPGHRH